MGAALAPARPVVLLTGDVAFFYDRNAFWHNYPVPNLWVVLFNDHGGGIFRLIDGPRNSQELEEFFETRQAPDGREYGPGLWACTTFRFRLRRTGSSACQLFQRNGRGHPRSFSRKQKPTRPFFEEYRAAVKQAFSLTLSSYAKILLALFRFIIREQF